MGKWVVPRSCQPLPRCSWAMLRCSQKPPRCSWLTPRCCRPYSGAAGPCHGATGCCRSVLVPGVPVQGLAAGPAARWGRLHVALEESCTGVGRNLGGGGCGTPATLPCHQHCGACADSRDFPPPQKKALLRAAPCRRAGSPPGRSRAVPCLGTRRGNAGGRLPARNPKNPPAPAYEGRGAGGAVPIPPPGSAGEGGASLLSPPLHRGRGGRWCQRNRGLFRLCRRSHIWRKYSCWQWPDPATAQPFWTTPLQSNGEGLGPPQKMWGVPTATGALPAWCQREAEGGGGGRR